MAGNLSNYIEEKLLNHSVGKTSFTMPTAYWALLNTSPGEDDSGTEVATPGSSGYARQTGVSWNAYTAGTITNSTTITWGAATDGTWLEVNYIAAYDAASGGNLLWYGPTTQKTVGSGDYYQITATNLSLTMD